MEKFTEPLVSICIPAYNAELYISETLVSLLKQSYTNLEIIIVDDHSTDSTVHCINRFADHRIKLLKATKQYATAARNQALAYAKGEYVIFLDADDLFSQDFITNQLSVLNGSKTDTVISNWGRFEKDIANVVEDPHTIKKPLSFREWIIYYWTLNRHNTPPGRVMIPMEILRKSGNWNETLSLNDDFDFFSRVFSKSEKILYNDTIFLYRSGIGGLSTRKKGFDKQQSHFTSLNSGIDTALSLYNDQQVKIACANLLQQFIYDCYPFHHELINNAKKRIISLGGSNIKFANAGYTLTIQKAIGWRLTKCLKVLFTKG